MGRIRTLILVLATCVVLVGCKASVRGADGTTIEVDTRNPPLIAQPAPPAGPGSTSDSGSPAASVTLTPDQRALNALWAYAGDSVRRGDWDAFREAAKLMARLAGQIIRARSSGKVPANEPVLTDLDNDDIRSVLGHAAGGFDELDDWTREQ